MTTPEFHTYGEEVYAQLDGGFTLRILRDRHTIDLPHQCDEWIVAQGDIDEARAELASFIEDAQKALVVLDNLKGEA